MLYEISQYFLVLSFIGLLVAGIILVNRGYKSDKDGKRNLNNIRLGWIFIGSASISATILTFWYAERVGFYSLFPILLFILPLIIIAGLIATLSVGISQLVAGYSKPRYNKKIKVGWILLIINFSVFGLLATLLILFMSGLIPIALM